MSEYYEGLPPESGIEVGGGVHVRTVTDYYTGRLMLLTEEWIVLDDAGWTAQTGLLGDFIADGWQTGQRPTEHEYVGRVTIPRAVVTALLPWRHDLPSRSLRGGA